MLNLHRDFRRESVARPVKVRGKGHSVVVHVSESVLTRCDNIVDRTVADVHGENFLETDAEREHLKPATVGERRAGPVHEGAQAPCRLHDVRTGLQVKVVSVGEHRLSSQVTHGFR